MGKIIGIDLGTTFSAVAQLDDTGRAVIVHNDAGENVTPSVVRFNSENEIDVGSGPKRYLAFHEPNVFGRFKREMGTNKKYLTDYGEFSSKDLSSFVLEKLKKDTEQVIGNIDSAVVTVPANFSSDAREDTLNAAKKIGLNISHIIDEPTAAALYYAKESNEDISGHICVYDLGGGTFDVSIVKVNSNQNEVDVVSSEGVHELGGTDFDEKLLNLVIKKFKDDLNKNITENDFTLNDAESLKIDLSKREEGLARAKGSNLKILRQEFEDEISGYLGQTEMLCESVLDDAGLKPSDISHIILAGGSTRIPCFKKSIKKVFGKEPLSFKNPDELVGLGAAIYAAFKADSDLLNPIQKEHVAKIKFSEISSKHFGTLIHSFNEKSKKYEKKNDILIEKGQKIPASETRDYYTMHEGQEALNCTVTESNSNETDPNFVYVKWEGQLKLPPGREKNQRIDITFGYDENKIMKCSFLDVESNKKIEVDLTEDINNEGKETDQEVDIDQFIVE
jgi:molecular chaperone DnaK